MPKLNAGGVYGGLTTGEAAVMDLWDAQLGSRAIARHLNRPHDYVRNILATYASNEQRADNAVIAAGSSELLAALRRARPDLGA